MPPAFEIFPGFSVLAAPVGPTCWSAWTRGSASLPVHGFKARS